MKHRATAGFWRRFEQLDPRVQDLARKNHRLLAVNPLHPSLRFKKLAGASLPLWSVRVGRDQWALAVERQGEMF